MKFCPLLIVVCYQVPVSASGSSVVLRNPNKCGVFKECDYEAKQAEAMTRKRVEAPQEKTTDY